MGHRAWEKNFGLRIVSCGYGMWARIPFGTLRVNSRKSPPLPCQPSKKAFPISGRLFLNSSGVRISLVSLGINSPQHSHQQLTSQIIRGPHCVRPSYNLARGLGFEPRLEVPKTPVLPLDDPRACPTNATRSYCTDFTRQYKGKYILAGRVIILCP